jgi:hypothetical protein
VEFNEAITKNVELLEPRARALAQDEISRAQALDQKTTGLIAAALVLVAAGVAFASHLNEVSAGTGARTLWGVLIVVLLVLLLASLGFATAVMHPQPFRVAIHKDELEKWATPRFLDRDPTRVLGELMQRIRALKTERHQAEAVLSELDLQQRHRPAIDLDGVCSVLDSLPDLSKPLTHAEPELQRRIFEVFHLRIELDRNAPHVRLSALVSSAFAEAGDLDSLAATVTDKAIAGERSAPVSDLSVSIGRTVPDWPGS